MAVSWMRIAQCIRPYSYEQFGHCGVSYGADSLPRCTERISSFRLNLY